jgi:hypothetical protein
MSEQSQSTNPAVNDVDETVLGAEQEQVETPETKGTDESHNYSDVTPYAAAELANRLLGVKEGDKPRTSQTFYSYARNHSIESNYDEWVRDGGKKSGYKVELKGDAFMKWLQDTADGKISGRSRNDYDRLAEEFALDAE